MEDVYWCFSAGRQGRRDRWEESVGEGGRGWRVERVGCGAKGRVTAVIICFPHCLEWTSDERVNISVDLKLRLCSYLCLWSVKLCLAVCDGVCQSVWMWAMLVYMCVSEPSCPSTIPHHRQIIPFLLPIFSLLLDWTGRDNLGLERAVRPGVLLIHLDRQTCSTSTGHLLWATTYSITYHLRAQFSRFGHFGSWTESENESACCLLVAWLPALDFESANSTSSSDVLFRRWKTVWTADNFYGLLVQLFPVLCCNFSPLRACTFLHLAEN